MISIIFPDSSVKKFDKGTKVIDVAKSISEGFARKVISASFNKEACEIESELHSDGSIKFYTWEDDEGKQAFWHSSAHILAQTIKFFYPKCKLTIGPSIENGFYYDVDFDGDTISEKDFKKIEVKFLEFARLDTQFKMKSISKKDALDFYKKEKTDRQRGSGVFVKSIEALQELNAVGYGMPKTGLQLDLVYNPSGAFLPGNQKALENDYKKALNEEFDILFNQLFAITNLPISRFLEYLIASENYDLFTISTHSDLLRVCVHHRDRELRFA